ncbi:MAG TPA: hypothetical protein VNN76_00850 [Bacteroidota bacterium]|nr:hypothetical protein [Bacteroidota bacterium]
MQSKLNLFTATTLIASLTLFSVGLPIVTYLCPMMSAEQPTCEMSAPPSSGIAVSSQTPDCCGKIIIAERNTTPYLKSDRSHGDSERILTLIVDIVADYSFLSGFFASTTSLQVTALPPSEPLFLLHASLLL